jgi:eukaryotic-like serine/threonine-protein kinase
VQLDVLANELRRRLAFRVAASYGLATFAVLQVAEPIMHALHLPDVLLTWVVLALAAGFPIAMTLAWAVDHRHHAGVAVPSPSDEAAQRSIKKAGATRVHVSASERRTRLLMVSVTTLLVAGLSAVLFLRREARVRVAREWLPQIAELVERGKYTEAFALAEQTEQVIGADPQLVKLWPDLSRFITVETVPSGAEVFVKGYAAPEREWRHLGRSPVVRARLPIAFHRWRIEKSGHTTVEAASSGMEGSALLLSRTPATLHFQLDPLGKIPGEMVRVPASDFALEIPGFDHFPPVHLGDYLIDRTEVTNREFDRFVQAGGYRTRELWRHPFIKEGRAISWEQAMRLFRDRTGRPGPATWETGEYLEGQGDLPVTGVSWFEAAAYSTFAGKHLPTIYQWSKAAGASASPFIVPRSNFSGVALAPTGKYAGLGPYGTLDMAGNAKEWCWNASGANHYILGGAWSEPSYMFNDADAQSPFARASTYGFRLVRALDDKTAPAAFDPVEWAARDYRKEKPVGPAVFRVLKGLYAYDKAALEANAEDVDDGKAKSWRKEKISFTAAYAGERVTAYLFTPLHGTPPYQTVLFFPGSNAIHQRSSVDLPGMRFISPVVKSGRAMMYPVYKSTFERGDALNSDYPAPTAFYRDHVIMWEKDLARSIDYVETRKDLRAGKVALYGVSWGAELAPLLAVIEDRIKVGIVVGGGLGLQTCMPEADPFHFAPHVRQPMLMVNGRYDFFFPYDTSQLPLFERLGSPAKDKRHVVFEAGHVPPNDLLTKEVLDWLDRYLGPVR